MRCRVTGTSIGKPDDCDCRPEAMCVRAVQRPMEAACAAILALPFESMEQLTQFPAGDHERGYNEALAEVRAILAQHGITKD
jgi:sugar phosphate isomerase/epimerase